VQGAARIFGSPSMRADGPTELTPRNFHLDPADDDLGQRRLPGRRQRRRV